MPETNRPSLQQRLASAIRAVIDWCYDRSGGSRFVSRDLFRYGACGGGNMAADALLYWVIYHYLVAERYFDLGIVTLSPHIASLIAVFPLTFFNGFWLNRHVVFRDSGLRTRTQLGRYLLTVAGAIVLNYGCMKLFVEAFGFWATPSKLLTTVISALYSFAAARWYTFRRTEG